MSLFGKKSPELSEQAPLTAAVTTIPTEFYGGANPVVTFKKVAKEVALDEQGQIFSGKAATPVRPTSAVNVAAVFTNWKYLAGAAGIVLVFTALGYGGYYLITAWSSAKKSVAVSVPVPPAPSPHVVPSTVVPPPPIATVPPTTTPATTTPLVVTSTQPVINAAIDFPSPLLVDTIDSDKDGLTDAEEELFRTDPHNPDTDHDGYSDSHEVYNLYNPIGKEPMKLIDSGLVKEYQNPAFNYHVYYPVDWAVGVVDAEYRDVLFSTLTGEHIEVRVIDKPSGQSFADWFAGWAPHEQYGNLVPFESRFKEQGYRRSDYLVYYFTDDTHVYVILYHVTSGSAINYRTVIKMAARSFRFDGTASVLPNEVFASSTPTISSSTPSSVSSTSL